MICLSLFSFCKFVQNYRATFDMTQTNKRDNGNDSKHNVGRKAEKVM